MTSILIIDAHPDRRAGIRSIIRRRGMQIWEAASGHDALALVGGRKFQVVIVDMEPPDMDGLRLLRRVRFLGRPAAIIALCRIRDAQQIRSLIKAGAISVLDRESPVSYMREQINNILICPAAVY